jgi:predicted nuclease of restriction endonuclease-like (RecB) superfamily
MDDLTLARLADRIGVLHERTARAAAQQINAWLTIRNWSIGWYIAEYELKGADRADYGERFMAELAGRLKSVKGLSSQQLYRCLDFYRTYPQIFSTASGKLQSIGIEGIIELKPAIQAPELADLPGIKPDLLLSRLSFSHFVELLLADTPLKRAFYEVQAVKNNWSVRELKRARETLLFERTGLSADKEKVLAAHADAQPLAVADVIKNPYVLEFLGLPEHPHYSEADLESAIIAHLQTFLVELGRGFCFEARQKRITFDNEHYFIDLGFYHRILKCHVLIDLKVGAFKPADAGLMNLYLNYYSENERTEGDNPPVGLILCAEQNQSVVRYATAGLSQQLFVSKYQALLPTAEELQGIIREEQQRLEEARAIYAVARP